MPPRMSRANRLARKAELAIAKEENPEARANMKRLGLAVGKQVLYREYGEPVGTRYGTVKEMHLDNAVIQQTDRGLLKLGEEVILYEIDVPFSQIVEVLGDHPLATRKLKEQRSASEPVPPPPRAAGYESCDVDNCTNTPVKAYLVKKYDPETKDFGQAHIIAACRDHDDNTYIPASNPNKGGIMETPAVFPLLWYMGVEFQEWNIPRPEKTGDQVTGPEPDVTFEFCYCGKEYGHRGFHKKTEDDDE